MAAVALTMALKASFCFVGILVLAELVFLWLDNIWEAFCPNCGQVYEYWPTHCPDCDHYLEFREQVGRKARQELARQRQKKVALEAATKKGEAESVFDETAEES